MPGRDTDSITRDMDKFFADVVGMFRRHEIAPDAESVTTLTVTMFDDYRNNTPRDVVEKKAEIEADLIVLEHKLFGKKGRRRR